MRVNSVEGEFEVRLNSKWRWVWGEVEIRVGLNLK